MSSIGVTIGFILILFLFIAGTPVWLSILSGSIVLLLYGIGTTAGNIPLGFFSSVDTFTMMAIPFFLLGGNIMAYGGCAEPIFNVMNSWFGKRRGGIPIATIATAMMYAAITGSTNATLAGITAICLPNLRRAGYSDKYSSGMMACAATLGQMIPPSILMIAYGGLVGVNAGTLFIAGIIPGFLCGFGLMFVAYLRSPKPAELNVVFPPETYSINTRLSSLAIGLPAIIMPVIILGSIYGGIMTPTEAGALSCVYGLFICLTIYRGMKKGVMKKILAESCDTNCMVFILCAASVMFAQPLTRLGVPQLFSELFDRFGFTGIRLVIAVIVIYLILGCFVEALPIMYLVFPVVLPALRAQGVDMTWFCIITILCLNIGQVTPPFGSAMFMAAKLIGIPPAEVIKESMPYLFSMLVLLVIIVAFPILSTCLI